MSIELVMLSNHLTLCGPLLLLLERKWQITPVFLPWAPHEQYKKAIWWKDVNHCYMQYKHLILASFPQMPECKGQAPQSSFWAPFQIDLTDWNLAVHPQRMVSGLFKPLQIRCLYLKIQKKKEIHWCVIKCFWKGKAEVLAQKDSGPQMISSCQQMATKILILWRLAGQKHINNNLLAF